MIAPAEGAR